MDTMERLGRLQQKLQAWQDAQERASTSEHYAGFYGRAAETLRADIIAESVAIIAAEVVALRDYVAAAAERQGYDIPWRSSIEEEQEGEHEMNPRWKIYRQILEGERSEVIRMIEEGNAWDTPDEYGDTALHMAAYRGDGEIVDALLRAGADAAATNCWGENPMHVASHEGFLHVVRKLCQAAPQATMRRNNLGLLPEDLTQKADIRNLLRRIRESVEKQA